MTQDMRKTAIMLFNELDVSEVERENILSLDAKELEAANSLMFIKFVEKYDLTL